MYHLESTKEINHNVYFTCSSNAIWNKQQCTKNSKQSKGHIHSYFEPYRRLMNFGIISSFQSNTDPKCIEKFQT